MRKLSLLPWLLPVMLPVLLGGTARGRDAPLRIGVLFWHESPNDRIAFEGVKEGFDLAGIRADFTVQRAEKDRDRARRALEGFEARGFDLVYTMGTSATLIAKETMRRLPVVFTAVTHPVGAGVVRSWEGSGGSLCGNSNWIARRDVFRVFQEAVPNLARLGVVLTRTNVVSGWELAEAKAYFRDHPDQRLKLLVEYVDGPEDIESATAGTIERGAQAIWIPIDYTVYRNLDRVTKVAAPRQVPLLSSQYSAVKDHHAIVGVAVDYRILGMRSVALAREVLLSGADPGKLPVARLRSFRVAVSLAAARRTGYRLPLELLARADEILDTKEER